MQVWLRLKLLYADYIKAFTFSCQHLSAAYSLPFASVVWSLC